MKDDRLVVDEGLVFAELGDEFLDSFCVEKRRLLRGLGRLPYEYLRVYSPSAEVRGHGPGQEVLQVGKREVGIKEVEPVGRYAIRPSFSDGHDTGIYSWDYPSTRQLTFSLYR